MINAMDRRISVRTYDTELPTGSHREQMERIIARERKGPFGNRFTFQLFNTEEEGASEEIGKMSSYGVIKNASLYFGGHSGSDEHSIVDYGFCFQEVVLELTAMELGTCWLGGTFSRGYVASRMSLPEGRIIPAISPVGYSNEKRSFADKISRFVARSKNRKPLNKILFSYSGKGELHPLEMVDLPTPVNEILESVRFAPSASNKQPWRIVRQDDHYHFYCDYDKTYNRLFRQFKIQLLDMGIALCHFTKGAEELRLGGCFSYADPHLENVHWSYILSWKTGTS